MKILRMMLFFASILVSDAIVAKQPANNRKSASSVAMQPKLRAVQSAPVKHADHQVAPATTVIAQEEDSHEIVVEERPLQPQEVVKASIDETIERNEEDGSLTKTLTTTQVKDDKVVTTTENWTWKDTAMLAAKVGLAGLAAGAAYVGLNSYKNPEYSFAGFKNPFYSMSQPIVQLVAQEQGLQSDMLTQTQKIMPSELLAQAAAEQQAIKVASEQAESVNQVQTEQRQLEPELVSEEIAVPIEQSEPVQSQSEQIQEQQSEAENLVAQDLAGVADVVQPAVVSDESESGNDSDDSGNQVPKNNELNVEQDNQIASGSESVDGASQQDQSVQESGFWDKHGNKVMVGGTVAAGAALAIKNPQAAKNIMTNVSKKVGEPVNKAKEFQKGLRFERASSKPTVPKTDEEITAVFSKEGYTQEYLDASRRIDAKKSLKKLEPELDLLNKKYESLKRSLAHDAKLKSQYKKQGNKEEVEFLQDNMDQTRKKIAKVMKKRNEETRQVESYKKETSQMDASVPKASSVQSAANEIKVNTQGAVRERNPLYEPFTRAELEEQARQIYPGDLQAQATAVQKALDKQCRDRSTYDRLRIQVGLK